MNCTSACWGALQCSAVDEAAWTMPTLTLTVTFSKFASVYWLTVAFMSLGNRSPVYSEKKIVHNCDVSCRLLWMAVPVDAAGISLLMQNNQVQ